MPTYWTKTLIPTSRQTPGEAEVPSHQLMLRSGLIRRLGSGVYSYLPLGLRSLQKIMAIIREEMATAGAIEVLMPSLVPIELFAKTGRDEAYGDNLFRLSDRHGRKQALGPTHEEVITEMVGAYVSSYRQLPLTLYQIQTKFRDEYRPRFGVLRSREFQMKDAYSFHSDLESLDETYQAQFDAYCRIFARCGLPYRTVEAESGPIGGSASHEFMVPSPTGEDTILESDKGNYAANVEKCEIGERNFDLKSEPTGELQAIKTPNTSSIEELCASWKKLTKGKLKPENTLKTLVIKVLSSQKHVGDPEWILAVVRGDHELNIAKLKDRLNTPKNGDLINYGFDDLVIANDDEVAEGDFKIGYIGPDAALSRDDVLVVVDPDAAQGKFWVTGANQTGWHVRHFNWWRDLIYAVGEGYYPHHRIDTLAVDPNLPELRDRSQAPVVVLDIRNAVEGDPSPKNDGGILKETTGIEIGHVFKLGDKYSIALDVEISDDDNQRQPIIMGCYGIGVNRILAAAIEKDGGHDDNGVVWPAAIAPYQVLITPIKFEGAVQEAACGLATELEERGIDVLIDDREERPGVKFNDADLIGIPLRITIGDKGLIDGNVELKPRRAEKPDMVPLADAAQHAADLLATL